MCDTATSPNLHVLLQADCTYCYKQTARTATSRLHVLLQADCTYCYKQTAQSVEHRASGRGATGLQTFACIYTWASKGQARLASVVLVHIHYINHVNTIHTLKVMRLAMFSQCGPSNTGVRCSHLPMRVTSLAAPFCTRSLVGELSEIIVSKK